MAYDRGLALDARPECEHGPMERRGGISAKSRKPFIGWFCPEQPAICEPQWGDVDDLIQSAIKDWKAGG